MKRFLSLFLVVACLSLSQARAHADEFATIPAGDAIHGNLSALNKLFPHPSAAKVGTGASLTHYEAALETARDYYHFSGEASPGAIILTHEGAQALSSLVLALRPELRELNVDTDAMLALAQQASHPGHVLAATASPSNDVAATDASWFPATASRSFRGPHTDPLAGGLWGTASPWSLLRRSSAEATLPLSQHLRLGAALTALQRESLLDPFGDSDRSGLTSQAESSRHIGTSATMAYDVNPYITLHAGGKVRDVMAADRMGASPLAAPLFSGSNQVRSTGGGVDFRVSGLRLSTDVARLSTDAGEAGTSSGVGVGLTAWQNRLSLSAHLSRLQPDDSALLASTATELKLGVDVTRRVSLGLLYQGLFTDQTTTNSSRVAGAINLSF